MARGRETQWLEAAIYLGRGARNAFVDIRRGRPLVGTWRRPGRPSYNHENSDHVALRRIFAGRVRPDDVLVDIGCGRGRVLAHWSSHYPEHRMVGIEIDPHAAARAGAHMSRHPNCTVVCGDAVDLLPEDGSLFYLYNPFGFDTLDRLRLRIEALPRGSRRLVLLYHNPKHVAVFEGIPAWTVEHHRLGGSRLAPFSDLAVITRTY